MMDVEILREARKDSNSSSEGSSSLFSMEVITASPNVITVSLQKALNLSLSQESASPKPVTRQHALNFQTKAVKCAARRQNSTRALLAKQRTLEFEAQHKTDN
jgi:hypothetical protein